MTKGKLKLYALHKMVQNTTNNDVDIPPHDKRIKSLKMPYYIQVWDDSQKAWINLPNRFANYNKAIVKYIAMYEAAKAKQPNWRKRPLYRLWDNLYGTVVLDHHIMTDASMLASWHTPKYLAAMLKAAERRKMH